MHRSHRAAGRGRRASLRAAAAVEGFLRGDAGAGKPYVHDEGFYAEHDIELRTGTRVTALDTAARAVTLEDGETLPYDALLLATGAASRTLPLPGADLPGVLYLRSLGESEAIQAAARNAQHVVIVGAGWIGSEVAASLRELGAEVALVAPERTPLERVLGPEVGEVFADLQSEHGIKQHFSTGITRIEGTTRATGVRTDSGELIAGDLVVIGVGVAPQDSLAKEAGLEVDNGILVDEFLQTSVEGVFAAGDVANAWHPVLERRIRVEHWANAKGRGAAAARNLLGQRTAYTPLPYFCSDQFDLGMEYTGYATQWDQLVLRGDVEGRRFLAFWLKDGRVLAGMNVNIWDASDEIKALVSSDQAVDAQRLADPAIPLSELLTQD